MSIFDQIASALAADFVTGPTVNPQHQAPQPDLDAPLTLNGVPLYPKRTWVGLTDEEVEEIFQLRKGVYPTIRATEAKLKEKNT